MNTAADLQLNIQLDRKEAARWKADEKFMERMEPRWDFAETQIGELCRNGATVFYVFPQGGKYREGTRAELVDFLIRNNYA